MGFYSPETPVPLIISMLVFTGFWNSTFWTGSSVFVFADVDDKDAGQANVISQVTGQLTMAMGIAVGGGVLEAAQALRGDGQLLLSDFHAAFFIVGAICAISTVMFTRLPANAGHQLTRQPHAH
jgi:hypothetical protein